MDFQEAISIGYYFDRCIDLEFYSTEKQFLGKLVSPKRGLKPTITIKGSMIPGGYSVNSYILVQNMTYDIDIASIGYIKAHMYYSGIAEGSINTQLLNQLKKGKDIIYSVLYYDQDKEPPNRCVRFQCVVASQDTTRFETPVFVNGSSLQYDTGNIREVNITDKSNRKTTIKNLAIEIANVYNKGLQLEQFNRLRLKDEIGITSIEIDNKLKNEEVILDQGTYSLGDLIRELNSKEDSEGNNLFKILIVTGKVKVSRPLPLNWRQQAKAEHIKPQDYIKKWLSEGTSVFLLGSENKSFGTEKQPVPLNYVRYATRSEVVINLETMFDTRIKPDCFIKINSRAIMGKKRAGSGSRLINYGGEVLTLLTVGDIEYLFSTTEDSYMKITAVVTKEEKDLYLSGKLTNERKTEDYINGGADL